MGRHQREFQPFLRAIRDDIFVFCRALRFVPSWQQRELFQAVMDELRRPRDARKGRFAVKSGQGPGKTAASIVIALWLLIQRKDTLGVLSAPSLRQCKDVWITEAERIIEKADPWLRKFFEVKATRIICCGRKKWAITVATAVRAENLQGYHQERLFFILDECSGIKREIIETVKGTVTNENALVLAIGNPNTLDCAFYDFFHRERDLWHNFTWNAEKVPDRVSPHNLRLLALEYGIDSDVYRVRVLGEFPSMDPNCIIDLGDLEACSLTDKLAMSRLTGMIQIPRAISYDFARYGGDENIVMQRSGMAVIDWKAFPRGTTDPSRAVAHGFLLQRQMQWANAECWHIPDATGMGQGLMHRFHDARKQVHEFVFNASASQADYKNKITEAWFNFRQLTRTRKLWIPNDSELFRQLTTRQYALTKDGKFEVESKDEYLKRGSELSPDRADAMVMLYYDRMMTGSRATSRATSGNASIPIGSRLGVRS